MRGHVRKRGKKWAIVVDVGRDETGRRKQKWHSGYPRRKDAEEALAKIIGDLNAGTYAAPSKRTVAEYLVDEWLPGMRHQVRPSTWSSYEMNLRTHVVPHVGGMRLRDLTGVRLNALYGVLVENGRRDGQGLSPRSVRYVHGVLRHALADAKRNRLVAFNAADDASPPSPKQTRDRTKAKRTWSPEQLRAFLSSREDDRLYALWHLFASTGMRRGEALGLHWDAVDLDRGTVEIRTALVAIGYELHWSEPKTDRSRRSIALDPHTVQVLHAHRKRQLTERLAAGPAWTDHGLVFTNEVGEPVHPDRASKLFEAHEQTAGLPHIGVHGLRHGWATMALRAGVHPKVVQERLGHSTIAMTLDTYSHAVPSMESDAANLVAQLVAGEDAPPR
jgi:integrase